MSDNRTFTLSTDTRFEWIDKAWSRRRWFGGRFGPRAHTGTWFATHVDWRGAWGTGDTREEAADDLAEAITGLAGLRRFADDFPVGGTQ